MTLLVVMLLAFFESAGVTGETIRGPDNQVAIVGTSVTLKCSSGIKGCSSIEWLKTELADNSTSIYLSYVGVSESFRERYRVEETEGCDLVIRNLAMSDAGPFVCRIANVDSLSASLIILESVPTCERLRLKPSGSDSKSDELAYHCALTYGGLVEKATMIWKYVSNGTQVERVPPQHQMGGTISRSFFRSVEQLPEDQPLRCVTRFRVPAERDRASNVPEARCETVDRWQNGTENVTRADFPPTISTHEEKQTPVTYIVIGAVVFGLAIVALAVCLTCARTNYLC